MTGKAIKKEFDCSDNKEYERKKTEDEKKIVEEFHNMIMVIFEEKEHLKKLHFMRCPKCGMELIEIDYKGIKVDKCSECEGIWLDAGELEAISKLEKTVMDKFFSVFKN